MEKHSTFSLALVLDWGSEREKREEAADAPVPPRVYELGRRRRGECGGSHHTDAIGIETPCVAGRKSLKQAARFARLVRAETTLKSLLMSSSVGARLVPVSAVPVPPRQYHV